MMTTLGGLLLAAGAVLLVIAAWGVIVLPDALARQHAATKAGTLALTLVCVRLSGAGKARNRKTITAETSADAQGKGKS